MKQIMHVVLVGLFLGLPFEAHASGDGFEMLAVGVGASVGFMATTPFIVYDLTREEGHVYSAWYTGAEATVGVIGTAVFGAVAFGTLSNGISRSPLMFATSTVFAVASGVIAWPGISKLISQPDSASSSEE